MIVSVPRQTCVIVYLLLVFLYTFHVSILLATVAASVFIVVLRWFHLPRLLSHSVITTMLKPRMISVETLLYCWCRLALCLAKIALVFPKKVSSMRCECLTHWKMEWMMFEGIVLLPLRVMRVVDPLCLSVYCISAVLQSVRNSGKSWKSTETWTPSWKSWKSPGFKWLLLEIFSLWLSKIAGF